MEIKKNIKHLITKAEKIINKKTIAKIALSCACMVGLSAAAASNYTIGYSVAVSGKNVGYVESKDDANYAIEKINNQYSPYFSGEDAIYAEPVYAMKIVKREDVVSESLLMENIKSTSPQMRKQNVIVVNGTDVVGLSSNKDAKEALEDYKNSFVTENEKEECDVAFEDDVQIVEKYSPSLLLMSARNAVHMLSGKSGFVHLPVLKVSVASYETIEDEIPFETKEFKDDQLYEGAKTVEVEGENGVKETVVKTVRVNGEVKSEDVVSEKVEKEAVTQVLKVGTKERPRDVGTGQFIIPYNGTISSRFGTRWSRNHNGIDICGPVGSEIYASDYGVVEYASWNDGGYGNLVKINHNNGFVTYYAHCDSIDVKVGDIVEKGDLIAKLGNTGRSTGPHVHFEIRKNGTPENPFNYME